MRSRPQLDLGQSNRPVKLPCHGINQSIPRCDRTNRDSSGAMEVFCCRKLLFCRFRTAGGRPLSALTRLHFKPLIACFWGRGGYSSPRCPAVWGCVGPQPAAECAALYQRPWGRRGAAAHPSRRAPELNGHTRQRGDVKRSSDIAEA